jgi:hypothetical protein
MTEEDESKDESELAKEIVEDAKSKLGEGFESYFR